MPGTDLKKVPVLHQVLHGQPALQALSEYVVDLDDLLQSVRMLCHMHMSILATKASGGLWGSGGISVDMCPDSVDSDCDSIPPFLTMSFMVMSSSLLAPSISTLGRMATGGTARCDTTRCSGRPTWGKD